MIENYLRPSYQKYLVDKLASYLVLKGCSADMITILSGFFGLIAAIFIVLNLSLFAVFFLLLSGYCDTLDGTIARFGDMSSERGTVLDITIDRLVEFMIIFALYWLDPSARSMMSLLMLGSILICVTTFLVVGIFSENRSEKSFFYSPGLIERPEAFFFFILFILIPQWFNPIAVLFTFLVFYTSYVRLNEFLKQI